jgi:hypothetical protein
MTAPRVRCAAADLWGDKHQCGEHWYVVTDPACRTFDLCSVCCLIEYVTLGALPADIRPRTPKRSGKPREGAEGVA